MSAVLNWKIETTTDATRGRPLAARVLARKRELEDALEACAPDDFLRQGAMAAALATAYTLLTGDLSHLSDGKAHALNAWLERNKHLA
jgi:hypothetical protein